MQKKKAISLIVLVITIIVMIILAGSIILTLSNNGIIDKASEAVDKSDEANIKSIVQTYWAEAYAQLKANKDEITKEVLETEVWSKIGANKLEDAVKDYVINVKTNGITVVKGWKQEGLTVRRGTQVLNIGDNFEYDETADGTKNVSWQVLGASDEGELLLLSSDNIDTEDFQTNIVENVVDELDKRCEPYGKGKNATGARSINLEDIDRITGYDPKDDEFGKGEIHEYGNKVIYYYIGNGNFKYTSTNGKEGKFESLISIPGQEKVNYSGASEENPIKIATIEQKGYSYDLEEIDVIKQNSNIKNMILDYKDGYTSYYLGNVNLYSTQLGWTLAVESVFEGIIYSCDFSDSVGSAYEGEIRGIRAVVSLSADTQIKDKVNNAWTY